MRSQVNGIVIAGDINGSIAEAPAEIILEAGFKSADPMQQVRRTFVGWPAYGDHVSGWCLAIEHNFLSRARA